MEGRIDRDRLCRLQYLLTGSMLVSTIFLVAALVVLLAIGRNSARAEIGGNLRVLAMTLSEQVESSFRAAWLMLHNVRQEIDRRGGRAALSDQELHRLFKRQLTAYPETGGLSADAISIVDRSGRVYASSVEYPTAPLLVADRDYFRTLSRDDTDSIYLSELSRSRATGEWVVFIALRLVTADGAFDGVLTAPLRASRLDALHGRLGLEEGAAITLMRADGRPLYRYPFDERFARMTAFDMPAFDRMAERRSGYLRVPGALVDDRPSFIGFHAGSQFPLIATVTRDERHALAAWRKNILVYSLVTITAIVLLFVLFLFTRRQVARLDDAAASPLSDATTGLPTRNSFEAHLASEWRRMSRDGRPLSVLFLDIDFFKRFNDSYGHSAGDDCLRQVGECIRAQLKREDDMVARYGGEEFVCVLPGTDAAHATRVALLIRDAVLALDVHNEKSPLGGRLTVSIGCATACTPEDTIESLLSAADRALHAAKGAGRDRVKSAAGMEGVRSAA